MQKSEKLKYARLVRDGEEDMCFYCGNNRGHMDDYTPNSCASPKGKEDFPETWTVAKCCSPCWRRIYSANVAQVTAAYIGSDGLMTVDQKHEMLGGVAKKKQVRNIMKMARTDFTLWPELDLILPVGAALIGDSIQIGVHAYTQEELRTLQAPILALFINRPTDQVAMALSQAMRDLDPSKLHVYEELLGLPGTSPSGSTF